MDITKLIPEKYAYYLEKFSRASYGSAFKQYFSECEEFFAALDAQPEVVKDAAAAIIDHIEGLLPRQFRRKLKFFDLKTLVFLYTVPAALKYGSDCSIAFVETLQAYWNEKYPNDVLNAARFEEINGSFNNTIMGFQLGGSK